MLYKFGEYLVKFTGVTGMTGKGPLSSGGIRSFAQRH
jgi:hypothetical protein